MFPWLSSYVIKQNNLHWVAYDRQLSDLSLNNLVQILDERLFHYMFIKLQLVFLQIWKVTKVLKLKIISKGFMKFKFEVSSYYFCYCHFLFLKVIFLFKTVFLLVLHLLSIFLLLSLYLAILMLDELLFYLLSSNWSYWCC